LASVRSPLPTTKQTLINKSKEELSPGVAGYVKNPKWLPEMLQKKMI